jgi:hypothetical protein
VDAGLALAQRSRTLGLSRLYLRAVHADNLDEDAARRARIDTAWAERYDDETAHLNEPSARVRRIEEGSWPSQN